MKTNILAETFMTSICEFISLLILIFLLLEKIAVPVGEVIAITLYWVLGAVFYQNISHL